MLIRIVRRQASCAHAHNYSGKPFNLGQHSVKTVVEVSEKNTKKKRWLLRCRCCFINIYFMSTSTINPPNHRKFYLCEQKKKKINKWTNWNYKFFTNLFFLLLFLLLLLLLVFACFIPAIC